MDTRSHSNPKTPAPSSVTPGHTGLFQQRPFTEPVQETLAAHPSSYQPQNQLSPIETAARLGHNFSRVQVIDNNPLAKKPQSSSAQKELQQDEWDSFSTKEPVLPMTPPVPGLPIQREASEDEPIQMMPQWGFPLSTIQRAELDDEPVQMIPQLGTLQRLPPEADADPIPMLPNLGLIQRKPAEYGDESIQMPQVQLKVVKYPDIDTYPKKTARAENAEIQTKLTVGAPNDVYEQEADRVADQVMSMPNSATQQPIQREAMPEEEEIQTKPLVASITPLVQREAMPEEEEEPVQTKSLGDIAIQREAMPEEEEEVQTKPSGSAAVQLEAMPEEEEVQTKPLNNLIQREAMPEEEEEIQTKRSPDAGLQAGSSLESRLSSSQGGGSPLPEEVRAFMEPRFSADFSQVRVHTGSEAVQMNRDLSAQAFTHGQDIFFGSGKSPGQDDLTAHELTHVVQQTDSVRTEPTDQTTVRRWLNPDSSTHPLIQRKKTEPTEHVAGILWATDATGKMLPPSLDDISQGGVADCFLFAAMAAIVNTNPQQIVNMIQDNGNSTFTVTFKGIGLFSAAKQTVSADFAIGKHGNVTGRKALWPLIIEKAYAQQKGGIDVLDKGGNPGSATDDLLNNGPSRFDPREKSADYIMGKLATAKKEKWPMTILAPEKKGASKDKKEMADSTPGLHFWHSYTIIDIDSSKQRIKLFNPWGHDHPNGDGWMSIEQVRKFFIEVSIND